MDLKSVKRYLENVEAENDENSSSISKFPERFFEKLIMQGIHIDLVESGRLICSLKVPSRLLNDGNFLYGGAMATFVDLVGSAVLRTYGIKNIGVAVEINVSYLDVACIDEEIEIEAKVLRVGKLIAVICVEFRKKKTGKIIAQGRHTIYRPVTSKM